MTSTPRQALSATLLALLPFLSPAVSAAELRVALLFTDGPSLEQTARCLAVLEREKVHATFASVGRRIDAHPELTRATHAAGHEVVNHSYTRAHFRDLSIDAIEREVRMTSEKIEEVTGHPPRWFWVPFSEWDDRIAAAVNVTDLDHFPLDRHYIVPTDDWNPSLDAAAIRRRATLGIRDRTVIVFHEWRAETITELPAILAELKRQGCRFLTLSELAALPSH